MVKGNGPVRGFRNDRVRGILNLRRHIVIFKNTGEHGHGPDPVHLDIEQLVDRTVHLAQQAHQDCDITHRDIRIVAHHQDAAGQIEEHGTDAGGGVQDDHEPFAGHAFPDVQVDHLFVGGPVAFIFPVLPAEQLDQELAADGHGLIEDPVDLVAAFLGLPGQGPAGPAGRPGRDHEQRDDQDAQGGQQPVLPVHDHDGHDQSNTVGEDVRQGIGDDPLDPVDIAGHAGDDIPLVVGGEETLGHLLQMAVHAVAHVISDMLGDPAVQIALENADQIGAKGHGQGQQDQTDQSVHIPADQALVNDPSGQDRGHQLKGGRDKDGQDDQQHLLPVGGQIGEDPAQQGRRYFGSVGFFFFRQVGPSHVASGSVSCHNIAPFLSGRIPPPASIVLEKAPDRKAVL